MKIYGLEKLSLVDYDGKVCATLFTGKCNFRCGFCHNSSLVLDYDKITEIDQEYLFDFLKKRFGILDGVCITGGEPTLCPDLPEFIKKIKGIGYSVKLDTNGTNPELVKSLYQDRLVDYFAMDVKNSLSEYSAIIGLNNYDTSKIQRTVDFFLGSNCDYEFRTTLIREYHSLENLTQIGQWIKGAKKYALQNFKSGDNCIMTNLNPISLEQAKQFLEVLKNYIPNVILRGYE